MRTSLHLVLGPTEEPVSLDEMKRHLRVDLDADDALIEDAITEARATLEIAMRRSFVTTYWTLGLDAFPSCPERLRLPRPPLQSVQAITYLDVEGATQTLSPTIYGIDTLNEPGLVYLQPAQVWPSTYEVPNAVQIAFVAGQDDVLYVPAGIKSAIKLLVGHLYEQREASAERALHAIPMGVERLVWLYRALEAV